MQLIVNIGLATVLLASSVVMAEGDTPSTLPNNPKRVASFDLGVVDTLDQLNVPVKALPKQSLPKYLKKYKADTYTDIGGLKTPDLEKINELKPDLIVISGRQQAQYDEFAKVAPTINLSVNPKEYETSFKSNMILLGNMFNKLPEMSKELRVLDKQAQEVQAQAQSSSAKILITVHYKGRLMAADQSNYAGLIHGWLGVKAVDLSNIRKNNDAQRLVLETKDIAALNPDILFVIDRGEAIGEGKLDVNKVEDNYLKQTSAYKNSKVIYLTPDLWYLSGNGLQSAKLQIEEVGQALK